MKFLFLFISISIFASCTGRYLSSEIMYPFHYIKYQGKYDLFENNNKFEVAIYDSIAYLKCSILNWKTYNYIFDTLTPHYGNVCIEYGPLYACPCEEEHFGGHCDCHDCLDSIKSIVFFQGKYSQLYVGTSNLTCQIEDTTRFTFSIHWTVHFKNKLNSKENAIKYNEDSKHE